MLHRLTIAVALLSFEALSASAQTAPVAIGCQSEVRDRAAAEAAPLESGPLVLERVTCLQLPGSSFTETMPYPSPDGSAAFVYYAFEGLRIIGTRAGSPIRHFDGRITNLVDPDVPFAWATGSDAVWGVRQEVMQPSGWSLSPLRPTLFMAGGGERRLPALTHKAGGLDALHWAGGDGMGVAAFGTGGTYYKPERDNPHPAIAIVDARRGRVIEAVALGDVPGLTAKPMVLAVATVANGTHVDALITVTPSKWVWWPHGERPHVVPIDAPIWQTGFALTADGRRVLIMRNLSATGIICEHNPNCPPPVPSTGPIAELRDVESGRILWTFSGTAENFSNDKPPAISPDGRYALISMPFAARGQTRALVSMADGRIVQRLPGGAAGFLPDGRAWISGRGRLALYRVTR